MSFTRKRMEECDVKKIDKWFSGIHCIKSTIEYNPGKFIMSDEYGEMLQDILDFEVNNDDVWLAGYPGTASSWCQEIVWLIVNNLDFETSRNVEQMKRNPIIGVSGFLPSFLDGDSVSFARNVKPPRCLKSHEPYDLLPKQIETIKPKLIYIMRNPKDVFCSYYGFFLSFLEVNVTFEDAAEFFCQGKMPYGDYIDHCLSYWRKRRVYNIFFVTFEEILADTKKAIRDMAIFLDRSLTEEQVDMINNFMEFGNADKVRYVDGIEGKRDGYVLRKEKSGEWKNEMSPEISEMFDKWIKRKTEGTDLTFNSDVN